MQSGTEQRPGDSDDNIAVYHIDPGKIDQNTLSRFALVWLPIDELQAIEMFASDELRHLQRLTRCLCRHALSCTSGLPFSQFHIGRNEFGKPSVAAPLAAVSLQFNLSHVNDGIACAITERRRIGIDIMRADTAIDIAAMTEHFLSTREVCELETLRSPEERRRRALRLWIRKEAYLKATGEGFSRPPEQVDDLPNGWAIQEFQLGRSHTGAVVVEGSSMPRTEFIDAAAELQARIAVEG